MSIGYATFIVMEDLEYIEIPLHGKYGKGKVTRVDGDYDGEYFSQYKWYLMKNGYVGRAKVGESTEVQQSGYIYLHKEVCKVPEGMVVDHIDRDKLNNRSYNLRRADYKLNATNRKQPAKRKNTKNTYRGVHTRKNLKKKKYVATIRGKTIGYYATPQEAAKQYDKMARILYGDEAVTNF